MRRLLALLLGLAAIGLAVLQATPDPVPPTDLLPAERPDGLTGWSFCPQWRGDGAIESDLRAQPEEDVVMATRWWNGDGGSLDLPGGRVSDIVSSLRQGIVPVQLESGVPVPVGIRSAGELGRSASGCADWPSTSWIVGVGGSTEGLFTTLVFMNPFPQTATFDVAIYSEQGLEVVESLEGFSVPAGESREVDLTNALRLRTHLVAVVTDPEGLIFPAMVTTEPGAYGTAIGRPLAEQWYFPTQPEGAEAEVVVVNPSAVDVTVDVDHFGADGSNLSAEQFTLARRSSAIVAVPEATAVQVRADGIIGAALRTRVEGELGILTGTVSASRSWSLPGASIDGEDVTVSITNPGPTEASGTYRFVGPGGVSESTEFTVGAGSAITVEVRALRSESILVDADEPVVVGWWSRGLGVDLVIDAGVAR